MDRDQLACESCSTLSTYLNNDAGQLIPFYNMRIKVMDRTGTLNCILLSDVTDKMIGCPADMFEALDYETRSRIKWNYLLERCRITLQIYESDERKRKIKILDLDLVQSDEIFREMLTLK
ncbi:hypothetical protein HELRODRAFT_169054 [Helobdella robusta]|uniref:Replication factor A C-terminal domain-containing protein n=1 Tax=Helobdella robusta TaxID=6412 RepID=T1F1C0_HELRO|nr:hypothetical protein HELRODRAFT_169054 [Helobdella robusta]ESO09114.1 hypothetical protein HELRODRAFT_169054 [Helobdella robusta]